MTSCMNAKYLLVKPFSVHSAPSIQICNCPCWERTKRDALCITRNTLYPYLDSYVAVIPFDLAEVQVLNEYFMMGSLRQRSTPHVISVRTSIHFNSSVHRAYKLVGVVRVKTMDTDYISVERFIATVSLAQSVFHFAFYKC